jgi:hypothetical protein
MRVVDMSLAPAAPATDLGLPVMAFCKKYGISRSGYSKARMQGRTPEELMVFNRIYITPEAEQGWLEAQRELSSARAAARRAPPASPALVARPPMKGYSAAGNKLGRPSRKDPAGASTTTA